MAAWVAWRLLGPRRPPDYGPGQERPLAIEGRTLFVGEHEVFVREAGPPEADPVVLVPGWGADSVLNWYEVLPALAERFRVVAVDPPGQGKSDPVWGRLSVEELAGAVAGVMDTLGVERAAVAGYSMGGMVAQSLARSRPDLVERLVLAATAARVPFRARRARRLLLHLGRAFERLSPLEGARLRTRYLLRVGAVERRHARWLWEHFMGRDPTLFYEAGLAALDFDARAWVGAIRVPTLVVIPTEDRMIPTPAQRELAALVPDAEVVELEGAGHEACFTRAEALTKAMLEFLDR